MKTSVILAAALTLAFPLMKAQAADISGIKIGMSLDEAKAAFAPLKDSMKMHQIITDKKDGGFAAYRKGGEKQGRMDFETSGPADELLVFNGNVKSVWYLQRWQRLPVSERFQPDTLVESLRKKYGKETARNDHAMVWNFHPNGKQYFPSNVAEDPCQNSYRPQGYSVNQRISSAFSAQLGFPTDIYRDCGGQYLASWHTDSSGLVNEIQISLIDISAFYKARDEENARKEAEAQETQRKKKEAAQEQIKKGVKPSL